MPVFKRPDIPSEIVIEITGRCNMACTYCTRSSKRLGHLPRAQIKKVIRQAKALDIKAVRFTGGEPLLVPHLPEILSYTKSCGFYVLLNTNASILLKEHVDIFSSTVDNILVSLQGFDQRSSEQLTGADSCFRKKLENILQLKSRIPVFRLGTIITPTLIDHIAQYAQLVKRIRPSSWELFRPMTAPDDQDPPDKKVYTYLALQLLKLHQQGVRAVIANALPLCVLPNRAAARKIMLGAVSDDGHSRLVWDARGFFKPSYFINVNLGSSLRKAWSHPFLKEIHNLSRIPTPCRNCEDLPVCRSGSRVMAERVYGDYTAPDPILESILNIPQRKPCHGASH